MLGGSATLQCLKMDSKTRETWKKTAPNDGKLLQVMSSGGVFQLEAEKWLNSPWLCVSSLSKAVNGSDSVSSHGQ